MEEQMKSIVEKMKSLPVEQLKVVISELIPVLGEEEKKIIFEETAKELGLDVDYYEETSEQEKEKKNNGETNANENNETPEISNGDEGNSEEKRNAMLAQFM